MWMWRVNFAHRWLLDPKLCYSWEEYSTRYTVSGCSLVQLPTPCWARRDVPQAERRGTTAEALCFFPPAAQRLQQNGDNSRSSTAADTAWHQLAIATTETEGQNRPQKSQSNPSSVYLTPSTRSPAISKARLALPQETHSTQQILRWMNVLTLCVMLYHSLTPSLSSLQLTNPY